jgi:DNA-binding NtrC family response regulator
MTQRTKLGVLVIDRDPAVCLELREFLTREGYRARTVVESSDALADIKEGRSQIVLLEIPAADVSGVSFLHEIRAIDSEICVIAMTAHPSVEAAVETMKADAFDYLVKPLALDHLRQVLRRAIREKGLMVDAAERLNQQIGSTIRALRKDRNLTLKQLANKTGLSVSLISQIELGKSAASVATLHKLSAALGVSMAQLFETV